MACKHRDNHQLEKQVGEAKGLPEKVRAPLSSEFEKVKARVQELGSKSLPKRIQRISDALRCAPSESSIDHLSGVCSAALRYATSDCSLTFAMQILEWIRESVVVSLSLEFSYRIPTYFCWTSLPITSTPSPYVFNVVATVAGRNLSCTHKSAR